MDTMKVISNWRKSHFMMTPWYGTISALLVLCEANELTTNGFPHKRLVIWIFDFFSLWAWTNYLTSSQIAGAQISAALCDGLLWSLVNPFTNRQCRVYVFFVVCLNKLLNKQSSSPKFDIKADRPLHWSMVDYCPKWPMMRRLHAFVLLAWIYRWTNSQVAGILGQSCSVSQTSCWVLVRSEWVSDLV